MTTASKITLVRVVLIPVFMVLLLCSGGNDALRWMASWIVFIVIAREFAVTGLRLVAVGNGRVIAAGWSGKIKTSCTMVGLILMMAVTGSATLDLVVSIVILVTTVYSGVEYFCKNWDVLNLKA